VIQDRGRRFNLPRVGATQQSLTDHFVAHVTINANGTATVEFDNERLSCP
jgi:hypothetical protein